MRSWCWHPPTAMADGCENVTAGCAATCSPSWSIRRFHRITMAASGNCGPPPHTAKSQVASVLSGEPICSLAFDPSLEQQRDEERMRIRLFSQSWTGNLSFSRVEQIPCDNAAKVAILRILRIRRITGEIDRSTWIV